MIWKQTTSPPGVKEDQPKKKTAKCYVKIAIEKNRINKLL